MEENKFVSEVQETTRQTTEIIKQTSTLKMDTQDAVCKNKESLVQCTNEGQRLLALSDNGMTAELDAQIATFIERAKATVKDMTERRKKVTQVFDMVRKGFTAMENLVSVKNTDSVVYLLQERRNKYAAEILMRKQREEEERRKRERIEAAKIQLLADTKETLNNILTEESARAVESLHNVFSLLTLDNKERIKNDIERFPTEANFSKIFVKFAPSYPSEVPVEDAKAVMNKAYSECIKDVVSSYANTVSTAKDEILMRFDSKVAELDDIRRKEDEIKRRQEELARLADEERKKKEKELAEAEEERKRKAEEIRLADEAAKQEQQERIAAQSEQRNDNLAAEKATAQAQALFNQTTATAPSEIKVKVTKHIEVLDREGWLEIIQQWWAAEGATMTDDKLESKLAFMKKACEKLANKEDIFIKSDHLAYIDDVKAK